jgi:hypothetical protein
VPGRGSDVAGLVGRRTCPASAAAQIERSRCRRSSASAISRDAEPSEMRSTQPSSAGQNPRRSGCRPRQLTGSFAPGQPTLRDGVVGMDVGPVCGDVESSGFGGDQGVFVGLGCG